MKPGVTSCDAPFSNTPTGHWKKFRHVCLLICTRCPSPEGGSFYKAGGGGFTYMMMNISQSIVILCSGKCHSGLKITLNVFFRHVMKVCFYHILGLE